jgi:hypothetical protein
MTAEKFQPIDLDDEFEAFMRKVNPQVRQHEAQYKESRRVWFAACAALFHHMANKVTEISDDEGVKEYENVTQQLQEFMLRVKEGRD